MLDKQFTNLEQITLGVVAPYLKITKVTYFYIVSDFGGGENKWKTKKDVLWKKFHLALQ